MKKFEELDVIDDFLMNALANDVEVGEEFCKSLVKGLLQRELGKIRVNVQRVITPETPKQRERFCESSKFIYHYNYKLRPVWLWIHDVYGKQHLPGGSRIRV